jgi:hypothetical protein
MHKCLPGSCSCHQTVANGCYKSVHISKFSDFNCLNYMRFIFGSKKGRKTLILWSNAGAAFCPAGGSRPGVAILVAGAERGRFLPQGLAGLLASAN